MLTLLRNPTFTLFFLGNAISLIGFGLNLISISWLVLEETGSELALGKIMAAATIPGVLLALFAGLRTNLSGHPCVVLPNGFNNKDSPTSISFIADLYNDGNAIAIAQLYQEATSWHKRYPPKYAVE